MHGRRLPLGAEQRGSAAFGGLSGSGGRLRAAGVGRNHVGGARFRASSSELAASFGAPRSAARALS